VYNDHRVPPCWDNMAVLGSLVDGEIDEESRSSSRDGTFDTEHFA